MLQAMGDEMRREEQAKAAVLQVRAPVPVSPAPISRGGSPCVMHPVRRLAGARRAGVAASAAQAGVRGAATRRRSAEMRDLKAVGLIK